MSAEINHDCIVVVIVNVNNEAVFRKTFEEVTFTNKSLPKHFACFGQSSFFKFAHHQTKLIRFPKLHLCEEKLLKNIVNYYGSNTYRFERRQLAVVIPVIIYEEMTDEVIEH